MFWRGLFLIPGALVIRDYVPLEGEFRLRIAALSFLSVMADFWHAPNDKIHVL